MKRRHQSSPPHDKDCEALPTERKRLLHALETGFTLIELIAVIVILGILAAVALPRFIDLRSDAEAITA